MKYRVVFELETELASPRKWDWGALLELTSEEVLDIISIEEVE